MVLLYKYVFYGLIICLLKEAIASKHCNKDKRLLSKWNVNYYPVNSTAANERGYKYGLDLTMTCKNNYQLVDVEVVAGDFVVVNSSIEAVFGYTPSLIESVKKCYWSQDCTITHPHEQVLTTCVTLSHPTDSKAAMVRPNGHFSSAFCSLRDAYFLRPVHAKCLRSKLVKNICELKKGKRVCTTTLPERKGLIKSHNSFPWHYDETYRNLTWKCNLSLTNKKAETLVIGLKFVDVCRDDSLLIRTNKGEVNLAEMGDNKHLNFTKEDHGFVELEFSVSSYSNGCGGFLICYNEVKKKKLHKYDGKKRNVCDDLFNRKKIPRLRKLNVS